MGGLNSGHGLGLAESDGRRTRYLGDNGRRGGECLIGRIGIESLLSLEDVWTLAVRDGRRTLIKEGAGENRDGRDFPESGQRIRLWVSIAGSSCVYGDLEVVVEGEKGRWCSHLPVRARPRANVGCGECA